MTEVTGLLDGGRVRARRHELGLSERKTAALMGAGFSQTMLRSLEAGINHADLTIGLLQRLAQVLDLNVDDILSDTTSSHAAVPSSVPAPAGPQALAEHIDRAARRIGVVLTAVGKAMPEQVLVDLGETTTDQLPDVLAELDTRLAAAGARLHRVLGLVGIRPNIDAAVGVDVDTIRTAWRQHLGRVSLNVGQVNVLAQAARGELRKPAGNDQAVKAAELVNAGLLTRTETGGYRPSADTAFSLMLSPHF